MIYFVEVNAGIQRPDPPPSGKSQVTIGFLRNTGTEPPSEAIPKVQLFVEGGTDTPSKDIGPLWVQLLLVGGLYGPM